MAALRALEVHPLQRLAVELFQPLRREVRERGLHVEPWLALQPAQRLEEKRTKRRRAYRLARSASRAAAVGAGGALGRWRGIHALQRLHEDVGVARLAQDGRQAAQGALERLLALQQRSERLQHRAQPAQADAELVQILGVAGA